MISILIIVIILATKSGKEPEENRYFDPGKVLHLISAASVGGMQTGTFPPFNEIKGRAFKDVKIKLGPIEGVTGRTGFIDSDE